MMKIVQGIVSIGLLIWPQMIHAKEIQEQSLFSVPAQSPKKTKVGDQMQPSVPYANIWVDDKGQTHISSCRIEGLDFKSYAPPAAPQWIGVSKDQIESIAWAVLPVGYVGNWHYAPGPQWVITMSGRWQVETSDGQKIIQGPGEIQFNADTGAKSKDGKNGHISRTIGNEPNVQLIIKLKSTYQSPMKNCH